MSMMLARFGTRLRCKQIRPSFSSILEMILNYANAHITKQLFVCRPHFIVPRVCKKSAKKEIGEIFMDAEEEVLGGGENPSRAKLGEKMSCRKQRDQNGAEKNWKNVDDTFIQFCYCRFCWIPKAQKPNQCTRFKNH
jgi:hypothetical protein